ncbi:hypothetical protein HYW73_01550 [Candidatus Nomurabacteria bacterium]|nr:hypothetical protein [Candidatus Nomurabacteria bacterium]
MGIPLSMEGYGDPKYEELKKKALEYLEKLLKEPGLFTDVTWEPTPKEILSNPKIKKELINKLPKGFPFPMLDDLLRTLERRRTKTRY